MLYAPTRGTVFTLIIATRMPAPAAQPACCCRSLGGGDGSLSLIGSKWERYWFSVTLMGFHQKASFQNELFGWGIFVVAQVKRSWGLFYNFSFFFWYCFSISKKLRYQVGMSSFVHCYHPAYIGHPLNQRFIVSVLTPVQERLWEMLHYLPEIPARALEIAKPTTLCIIF